MGHIYGWQIKNGRQKTARHIDADETPI